ncbi:hypothetical protein [Streptomyces sp. NPDC048641]|uniref:hypothetical protein n=1 Tax=Streptomyces sp. NPDC048641 TaxID=3154825 RepID=UPI003440C166
MLNGITFAAAATGCTQPSLTSLAVTFVPWIITVLLAGAVMGTVVAWISRRAGDNAWESLRHAMTSATAFTGLLLTVLIFLINLVSQCR